MSPVRMIHFFNIDIGVLSWAINCRNCINYLINVLHQFKAADYFIEFNYSWNFEVKSFLCPDIWHTCILDFNQIKMGHLFEHQFILFTK